MDYDDVVVEKIHRNGYNLWSKVDLATTSAPSTSTPSKKNTTLAKATTQRNSNIVPNVLFMDYNIQEYMKKTKANISMYDLSKLA